VRRTGGFGGRHPGWTAPCSQACPNNGIGTSSAALGYGESGQAVAATFWFRLARSYMSISICANESANLVVRFPTSSASAVSVVGSFNDWTPGSTRTS
jgi:hypothetical protein